MGSRGGAATPPPPFVEAIDRGRGDAQGASAEIIPDRPGPEDTKCVGLGEERPYLRRPLSFTVFS